MSSRIAPVKWTLQRNAQGGWQWVDSRNAIQAVAVREDADVMDTNTGARLYVQPRFVLWNDASARMSFIPEFLSARQRNDLRTYLESLIAAGQFQEDTPFVMGKIRNTGRLVKDFGDAGTQYRYSRQTVVADGWGLLEPLRDYVQSITNARFNYAHVVAYNYTQTQRDKNPPFLLSMHKDDEPEIVVGSDIAAISLGAVATFAMMRDQKTPEGANFYLDAPLPNGSLFVMGGNMQGNNGWKHSVRRIPDSGRRISITFRLHRSSDTHGHERLEFDFGGEIH